jgi:hypothetical protein
MRQQLSRRHRASPRHLGSIAWDPPIPEKWIELSLKAMGQRAIWQRIG